MYHALITWVYSYSLLRDLSFHFICKKKTNRKRQATLSFPSCSSLGIVLLWFYFCNLFHFEWLMVFWHLFNIISRIQLSTSSQRTFERDARKLFSLFMSTHLFRKLFFWFLLGTHIFGLSSYLKINTLFLVHTPFGMSKQCNYLINRWGTIATRLF